MIIVNECQGGNRITPPHSIREILLLFPHWPFLKPYTLISCLNVISSGNVALLRTRIFKTSKPIVLNHTRPVRRADTKRPYLILVSWHAFCVPSVILKVVATLLKNSTPSAELMEVRRLFLSDMIKLFSNSRENRRYVVTHTSGMCAQIFIVSVRKMWYRRDLFFI